MRIEKRTHRDQTDNGLIDLAADDAASTTRTNLPAGSSPQDRIEIVINGAKHVFHSAQAVPLELRGMLDAIRIQAEQGSTKGAIDITHDTRETNPVNFRTEEILALLRQGKKIDAIKVLRERTGADLASAKHTVDTIDATLAGGKTRTGCLGMLVLAVGAGLGLLAMLAAHH